MCLLSITHLVLMSLTQKGMTVTLITKTSKCYEGVIASTESEGDTTGVTLRDVKELGILNAESTLHCVDKYQILHGPIEVWASEQWAWGWRWWHAAPMTRCMMVTAILTNNGN